MFENIFGTEVQVELLSSVKMGDDNCRIRIMKAVLSEVGRFTACTYPINYAKMTGLSCCVCKSL